MASWFLLAIASLLVGLAAATPSISFPINSQVPPVARIDKPFSFVFSPSTFSSSSEIKYTLAQSPDWISLDGEARRIYGTPKSSEVAAGEVVGVPVGIVATDDSGSVTMTATLVVSRNPPPTVSVPLSAQTPDFAPFSQPSSIIMAPDTSFDFTLASNTFSGALIYYAVMADNSPLPSWMTFDPAKLSFSGRTPPLSALVQTPQSFDFQLVASDVPGFSGASLRFSLVIGNHAVTAKESLITLNATVGERMSYTGLATIVKFDDKDAKSAGVSIVSTTSLPSWLELNMNTWEISGTPPEGATSSNFSITMQDQHSNSLNLTLSVSVTDGLFLGDLPALNVTAGESFTFDLGKYLASKQDLEISVTTNPPVDWVQYDAKTRVLSGDVPLKLQGSQLAISIDAKSTSSGAERTKQLKVSVLKPTLPTTLITAPPTTTSRTPLIYSGFSTSGPSTTTAPSEAGQDSGKNKTKTILLAVLIPLLLLALIVFGIVAFCIHRRRKRPSSIDRRDISRPVPGSLTHSGSGSGPEMAESVGTIDSYDTDVEISPAAYMARDMQGPYFTDASLLTPPPSRGGVHPSSGDAWPSSGAWPPSSAWRRSSNPYTPPKRPDIQANLSAPNLPHHTDTPTRAPYNRHIRNRTSRYRSSKILNVDIPDSNIFSGDSTPDSSFFAYTNFDSSPPHIGGGTITPPDRGTRLEDFIYAETIRRVPTESSLPSSPSSSSSHLAPPPLARLRTPAADTPPRPFHPTIHPRRLFADTAAPTEPPSMRSPSPPVRGGGPLSSSPWRRTTTSSHYYTYDHLGLPRSSSPTRPSSLLRAVHPAVRVESSVYSADGTTNNGQATPSMSPSRWPHPPGSQERPGCRASVSEYEDDGEGLPPLGGDRGANVSAEDVNEWIGVATSRYSKASSWLEAAAGFEGRRSQDVAERDGGGSGSSSRPGMGSSSRPGTAGRSSGDYPVYI
ncbi:Axial budding pattern protein 2 [Coniochaeta hoffmannii]|uniref:Axial budding pattern protein 2 n=1 Tax=Coniochaeta hoffmannii TaxID=91930 RepID=A0AA38VTB3_9PEZI|nr:Axial budding pattern protein 2 [Coniochaeta hoffmannii]